MKTFFKIFGLALGIQVVLLVLCVTLDSFLNSVLDSYLRIYEPFILFILRSGNYRGDAAMIDPVIKGVPLGVLVYSVVAGVLGLVITKLRTRTTQSRQI